MKNLLFKSILIGTLVGVVFFAISTLGLAIAFIEALRPVLIPGVELVQLTGINTVGFGPLALALLLNIFVYTLLTWITFLVLKAR